jgi:hypothetical protein
MTFENIFIVIYYNMSSIYIAGIQVFLRIKKSVIEHHHGAYRGDYHE